MDDDTRNHAERSTDDEYEDLPPTIQRRRGQRPITDDKPEQSADNPSIADDDKHGETLPVQPAQVEELPAFDFSPSRPRPRETAILYDDPSAYWRHDPNAPRGTATLSPKREIILVIRGMIERVFLEENQSVILGRADPSAPLSRRLINLMSYGALDRGVSRRHARLYLKDNNLYLTDLNSTNGTYLAGKRLNPNEPILLRNGDEILLGRLAIEILFH